MKVAFVLDDGMDSLDGVQQYMLTNGRWMVANGHEVHYLVGETNRTDIPNLFSLSSNLHIKFNKNRASVPVKIHKKRIKKLLNEQKYDVLHIQMPYSPVLSGFVIKNAPKESVVFGTFHILPYSNFQLNANKVFSKTLKKSLRRFDNFVSVSKPASQFAFKSIGMKSSVLPNSVDAKAFKAKPDNHAKIRIVFLGRLVERKGAYELLKAIDMLCEKSAFDGVEVVIGGKGPLSKKLIAFVKSRGLDSKVKFAGFIPEEEKSAFLASADIAVFPSLGGESFGIVLIEAMAAGSGVVLAGNNPGYASVIDDARVLLDPKNARAFAERLQELISDKDLREELHKKQQESVKEYDISVNGPRLVKLYEQALRKRRSVR